MSRTEGTIGKEMGNNLSKIVTGKNDDIVYNFNHFY